MMEQKKQEAQKELSYMQKINRPFIEAIYRDYLNKGGKGDEAVKSYIHVFATSFHHSMRTIKLNEENYKEIFSELSKMDRDDFYKMIFKKGHKASSFIIFTLCCCFLKDLYDGDFSKIASGGAPVGTRNLDVDTGQIPAGVGVLDLPDDVPCVGTEAGGQGEQGGSKQAGDVSSTHAFVCCSLGFNGRFGPKIGETWIDWRGSRPNRELGWLWLI